MSSTMSKGGSVFPYGISLDRDGVVSVFPAIEVLFFISGGEHAAFMLLIDSGARVSALPKFDAETLGIEAEKGVPTMVTGIGSEVIQGWRHEVPIILQEDQFTIPVLFLDNEFAPRILGREGVFDRFTALFQEEKRRSALVANNTKQSQAIEKVLDELV